MAKIYVLQLEQGKYFVGASDDVSKSLAEHMEGRAHDWTTMYRPVALLCDRDAHGSDDLDETVKDYMSRHGINNVRGGRYSRLILDPMMYNDLAREFLSDDGLPTDYLEEYSEDGDGHFTPPSSHTDDADVEDSDAMDVCN